MTRYLRWQPHESPAATAELLREWEPGYCIGRAWWGQWLTTEALRAVCGYWFDEVGEAWLGCCHAAGNPASGRVMQKAGFVYDHDDTYHKFDGTPVQCHVYAKKAGP